MLKNKKYRDLEFLSSWLHGGSRNTRLGHIRWGTIYTIPMHKYSSYTVELVKPLLLMWNNWLAHGGGGVVVSQ